MEYFQHLVEFFKPKKVTCNDTLDDLYEAKTAEDQYDAHQPGRRHKVPSFEHFMTPVLMVTGQHEFIKGFKFQFGLPLSEYFVTSHSWNIPNAGTVEESPNPMMMPVQQKPGYSFTTQLVQDIRGQQPYSVMMGKCDNEGKVDAVFVRKINQNFSTKITSNFQNSNMEQGVINAQIQYQGNTSNSIFKFGLGHWGFNHFQKVHPKIYLGFEYLNLTMQKASVWSYGFKAFIRNHSLFANYHALQKQYTLAYVIPIKRGTEFVSQYKYDGHDSTSTTTFGLKQTYQQSEILATISSKGEISTILHLRNPSFAVKLCANADYMKQKYTFGYGIFLGQSM